MTTEEKLESLVNRLADEYEFNWTRARSERDVADRVLLLMGKLGLIEARNHPSVIGGPATWIVNGRAYGRTDGVAM